MFIPVIHCTTTTKESACRIICRLRQQTSPKRWFANANMTSYYDVENNVYPVTMTTIPCCSILEFGRGHTIKSSRPAHHQTSARHWLLNFSDLISDFAFKKARKNQCNVTKHHSKMKAYYFIYTYIILFAKSMSFVHTVIDTS